VVNRDDVETEQRVAGADGVTVGREANQPPHSDVVRVLPLDMLLAAPRMDHRRLQACVAWIPTPTRRRREIILGEGDRTMDIRPMRVEAQRAFAAAYGKARSWLDRLVADPAVSVASIAASEGRTERSIRQTLSLAFLDPSLVDAAADGRLPRGFGLKRLMDVPADWSEQWSALGLTAPARS